MTDMKDTIDKIQKKLQQTGWSRGAWIGKNGELGLLSAVAEVYAPWQDYIYAWVSQETPPLVNTFAAFGSLIPSSWEEVDDREEYIHYWKYAQADHYVGWWQGLFEMKQEEQLQKDDEEPINILLLFAKTINEKYPTIAGTNLEGPFAYIDAYQNIIKFEDTLLSSDDKLNKFIDRAKEILEDENSI